MQTKNIENENNGATFGSRKQTPFLRIVEARKRRRPIRISLPVLRRESCFTRRAMLAALREAEFADWLASGGDYLDSAMHQPVRY